MTHLKLIEDYFDSYLSFLNGVQDYSVETVKAYKKDLLLLKNMLTDQALDKASDKSASGSNSLSEEVKAFLKSLHLSKYHQNSIYRIRCSLSCFYHYLIKQKVITSSPLDGLYNLKRKKTIPNFISESSVNEISNQLTKSAKTTAQEPANSFSHYQTVRDQLIWELLYGLGLRISEVTHLTLEKIDLEKQVITVFGKGKSLNLLPLTDLLSQLIHDYLPERNRFLNLQKKSHPFLLSNHLGNPITVRGVRFAFMNRLKKNQVDEKIYPHSLRHSIATHLLENGADIKRVQQLLRHKSIETTQVYTHLSKKALRESYEKYHPLANGLL